MCSKCNKEMNDLRMVVEVQVIPKDEAVKHLLKAASQDDPNLKGQYLVSSYREGATVPGERNLRQLNLD